MSKASFSSSQSECVSKVIPVFVYGSMDNGNTFQELAQTVVVDVRGGIIELESPVANGFRRRYAAGAGEITQERGRKRVGQMILRPIRGALRTGRPRRAC
jgi:hypothetical protein